MAAEANKAAGVKDLGLQLLQDGLLTVREAASLSRLSRSTLYTLMDSRKLSFTRVGKSRRIPRSALAALLASGLVEATA